MECRYIESSRLRSEKWSAEIKVVPIEFVDTILGIRIYKILEDGGDRTAVFSGMLGFRGGVSAGDMLRLQEMSEEQQKAVNENLSLRRRIISIESMGVEIHSGVFSLKVPEKEETKEPECVKESALSLDSLIDASIKVCPKMEFGIGHTI